MTALTPRQAQVLDLIRDYINATGYPPTRADIAQELGFRSPNAAEEHLKALARKGAIEMIPGTSRGIRLPEPAGLPIVGRVAAGRPILAEEHIVATVKKNEIPPLGEGIVTKVKYRPTWNPTEKTKRYFLAVKGLKMRLR